MTWFVTSIFGAPLLVMAVCYGVICRQLWIYSLSASDPIVNPPPPVLSRVLKSSKKNSLVFFSHTLSLSLSLSVCVCVTCGKRRFYGNADYDWPSTAVGIQSAPRHFLDSRPTRFVRGKYDSLVFRPLNSRSVGGKNDQFPYFSFVSRL